MRKIILIITAIILLGNFGFAKPPKYTIIFDTQSDPVITQQVDSGQIVQKINDPSKDNNIFQGWFDTEGIQWDFLRKVENDSIKITARWLSVEQYRVQQGSILWENIIKSNVEDTIKPIVSKVNLLLYVVVALAILLMGLLAYIFLVLNNKEYFRDKVLFVLTGLKNVKRKGKHSDKSERLINFKKEIVDRAKMEIEEILKKSTVSNQLKSIEKDEIVRIVLDKLKNAKSIPEQQISQYQPAPAPQVHSQSLYADAILDGKFNRVKEQPDDDTIFELQLNKPTDTKASVKIYPVAYRRVVANPSFLEGCEKQILGSNSVTMMCEGVAQKDGNGKWTITTPPEVKIS